MPPAKMPIVFNKLCDIIKHPSIFSEISYEESEGNHCVEGVINDKFFSVSKKSEKQAKDDFALAVFKAYHQEKPIKTKAVENKCIGQMMCWSSEQNVVRFHKGIRFEFAGQQGNEIKVDVNDCKRVKNEDGKTEVEKTQILSATAANIHDAKYDAGINFLNRDEYRDQYVAWIRNDKKGGYKKPQEGEQASADSVKPKEEWVKQEDGIEGENAQNLREFCEKYGLPAPEYFLSPEDQVGGAKALCKILLHAKNSNKEAACKVVNDVLVQICTEQSEARSADQIAQKAQQKEEQEAARAAKLEAAAEKKARREEHQQKTQEARAKKAAQKADNIAKNQEAQKRKADKTEQPNDGPSPAKKAKKAAPAQQQQPVGGMAVYTQEMLVAGFGSAIEQMPILALNEELKKNKMEGKVAYTDCVAPGGFNCSAMLNGVTCIGFSTSKKMAKQVAAQAFLMTLRTVGTAPSPTKKAGVKKEADANPVSRVNTCASVFKQEVSFQCDDGTVTPDGKVFNTVGTFGSITVSGCGKNKKESKSNAAAALLNAIPAQFGDVDEVRKANKKAKVEAMKTD